MSKKTAMCAIGLGCLAMVAGSAAGQADVITGDITGPFNGGVGAGPRYYGVVGDRAAYTIGTTSCNVGTIPLNWFANGTNHPVIGSSFYRITDGRFEHIAVGWVKHGFCALQQSICGPCTPVGPGCPQQLGVGCSDPYSSSLNGDQTGLGPRSEINAAIGDFQWPFSTRFQTGNATYKRVGVALDDINPALNAGAVFIAEGQYVAKDDAAAGNTDNNASYRLFTPGASNGAAWHLNFVGPTARGEPAIFAWRDHGLGVNTPDPDVNLVAVDVPNDGRFWIGYRVTENNDGTWRYEYVVHNFDSHRNGGGVEIPIGDGATITDMGFGDVTHFDEGIDGTDWNMSVNSNSVSWTPTTTWIQNQEGNAIRWGTSYNFYFQSDAAPVEGDLTLDFYTPGSPIDTNVTVLVPGSVDTGCAADLNDDGLADFFDVQQFLNLFAAQDPSADLNEDGLWDFFDVQDYLNIFAAGCP